MRGHKARLAGETEADRPGDTEQPSPAREFLANPDWARGYCQAQHDIPANLLKRIKQIEQSDGGWPGADVVDILTSWFTDLGFDIEADEPEQPDREDNPPPRPLPPPGRGRSRA